MKYLGSLLACLLLTTSLSADIRVDVGQFSANNLDGWQHKVFAGETQYQLQQVDGKTSLLADSDMSASAFYFEQRIDLQKTPILNWSWRKQQSLDPGNEKEKSGDDFVARVYVVKDGGLLFWNTKALNYVWSHDHAKDQVWDNPFAGDNAKMISVRDSQDTEQKWFSERRNVLQDFKQLHGEDLRYIDGVAIMTDSDNSGLQAQALYGDIFFTAQ